MIRERFLAWLLKEHTIVLDWKTKIAIIAIVMFLLCNLLPFILVQNNVQEFNEEIGRICETAKFESCENLEKAYPYCQSAQNWFANYGCRFSENRSKDWIEYLLS